MKKIGNNLRKLVNTPVYDNRNTIENGAQLSAQVKWPHFLTFTSAGSWGLWLHTRGHWGLSQHSHKVFAQKSLGYI